MQMNDQTVNATDSDNSSGQSLQEKTIETSFFTQGPQLSKHGCLGRVIYMRTFIGMTQHFISFSPSEPKIMKSPHRCHSTQNSRPSGSMPANIQEFLDMPNVVNALRHETYKLRSQQEEQKRNLRELCHLAQALNDRLDALQSTCATMSENIPAIKQSLRHIATSNEKLNETFYRKRVATPLGDSVVSLLELIERMRLRQSDTDFLRSEIDNLLGQFSMQLYEPTLGTPFDPQKMTCISNNTYNTPVVQKLICPGIIYRSDDHDEKILRQATVSLVEEGLVLSGFKPAGIQQEEGILHQRNPITNQVAKTR
jgi:hypothetical protein